jgi:uncharacterized protein (DUF3084 family)
MTMKTPTTLVLATTLVGGLFLASCGNTAQDQSDKMENKMEGVQEDLNETSAADTRAEFERERNDVLSELRTMRDDIDSELARTNERLAKKDLKADKRVEQEALKVELVDQKGRVEVLIANVEGSQEGTWISVKETTKRSADEVGNWWTRTKDNIDKMTDADNDKDGH